MSDNIPSAFLRTITNNLFIKDAFSIPEECFEQGEAAACQAYRRDQNPYPKGTQRHEWWDGGWLTEVDELTEE